MCNNWICYRSKRYFLNKLNIADRCKYGVSTKGNKFDVCDKRSKPTIITNNKPPNTFIDLGTSLGKLFSLYEFSCPTH